jgi:hypothetical protein
MMASPRSEPRRCFEDDPPGFSLLPLADPLVVSPEEMAVADWLRIRLAELHERHGIAALSVHATWYPHNGQIDARWVLHSGGECVIDQRSIAQGVRALKAKLAEQQTETEAP